MSLVSYDISSDSSDDGCQIENQEHHDVIQNKDKPKRVNSDDTSLENRKKIKLPVPDAVKDMYKDDLTLQVDDSASHGGRIRTFAHERGNWASFVYIPYNHPSVLRELSVKFIECLQPCREFHVIDDFHVSLSRTFVMRHHWIESLLESLRKNCRQRASNYSCELSGIKLYANDECTRTFLGLTIDTGTHWLKSLVSGIDTALQEYRLPVYYKNPSFHLSVAWAVGDVTSTVSAEIKEQLQDIFAEYSDSYSTKMTLPISELFLKTGNKSFNIPLS